MSNKIYGAFVLMLALVYVSFVTSLPFPQNYKNILYLPSLIMFLLFIILAMGKSSEEEATSGYFNI